MASPLPLVWQKGRYDGKLYSLALDTHPFVLSYNTDLAKRAGVLDAIGTMNSAEVLASIVVVMFWAWMDTAKIGLLTGVLTELGIAPVAWLQDPGVAMISVVVTTLWWTIGFNFLLYLAALQNIPEQQFEAAAIDGAGKWRQLFSIVIRSWRRPPRWSSHCRSLRRSRCSTRAP